MSRSSFIHGDLLLPMGDTFTTMNMSTHGVTWHGRPYGYFLLLSPARGLALSPDGRVVHIITDEFEAVSR